MIHGDCRDAVEMLQDSLDEPIRVIYIDPPFFSKVDYSIKRRTEPTDSASSMVKDEHSYSDKWDDIEEYLEFMKERFEGIRGLLAQNGSLWVHLDYHVSHYIKILLDDIFGYSNFVNEIVWRRTNSPKVQSKSFGSQHDVILLYAKDSSVFEIKQLYRPHDKRSLRPYSYEDERGKFRLIEVEAQGIQKTQGRKVFEWRGRSAPYLYKKAKLDELWDQGLIYTSKNGRYTKKQYLADVKGLPISDLWLDIPPTQGSSNEFTGFITQKPIALMKRVIESASSSGDIVADFFAGSGSTALAAIELDRRFIMCDNSDAAISMMKQRFADVSYSDFEYVDLENSGTK